MDINLYNKIKEDLAWKSDEKIINNCYSISHNPKNVIAVIWFNLDTKEVVYSTDPNSHHSQKDLYRDDVSENWLRCRIFKYGKSIYLTYYGNNEKKVQKDNLHYLIDYFNKLLNITIFGVVDYDGFAVEIH